MIGWLGGKVRVRDVLRGEVVLDVGGVGYLVAVSWQTLADVPEVGGACELWIHTHVREEALNLYGFSTPAERDVFRLLTSVPQVGPKLAVAVLGGFPLVELLGAIAGGERPTLERIPGVGRRTAERILLDLKDKVVPLYEALQGQRPTAPTAAAPVGDDALREEARLVLVNLGWKPKPVEAALDKAWAEADGTETLDGLVRRALAQLMAR
ncbi:Holliday junction branch migration protein RuvA [Paraliomyxa miuraensis]|uniref:Holliday junction branch migration protein RuvA n=1 Tax=Paraliomyxa miuraensis TaxID=376150 RepID=UPI00224C8FC8|nr:Holliday junction branch migration protein RuvA [Paraliomyxa miuraensis]MCX4245915.1 Holliday junction branch migration protein RuvA [Paraliomyxa miuraensis]